VARPFNEGGFLGGGDGIKEIKYKKKFGPGAAMTLIKMQVRAVRKGEKQVARGPLLSRSLHRGSGQGSAKTPSPKIDHGLNIRIMGGYSEVIKT